MNNHITATSFSNLADRDYRNAKGLSKSMLTHFLKSPAHYQQALLEKQEPTEAMNFGTAFHATLLLDDPLSAYAVKRKVDGRTKEGKEYNEQFAIANEGKAIINEEQAMTIANCISSINNHPFAADLMQGISEREFSLFGGKEDNVSEMVLLKGRLDAYDRNRGFVIDYKTCEDASPNGFKKAIWNFRYDLQVVQYSWLIKNLGLPYERFYFICVEKAPPYAVGVYWIDSYSIINSTKNWDNAISEFSECQKNNIWPAYSNLPVSIEL